MSDFARLRARVHARRCAVQSLYQWQISGKDPANIHTEFIAERELDRVDLEYFRMLTRDVPARIEEIDQVLIQVVDRPLKELDPVERAVLAIGVYELMFRLDIPIRVVINEAIELTKMFGADQAYKYVNGVLDKVARIVRTAGAA
jgi:transcription antitermination protein NusB